MRGRARRGVAGKPSGRRPGRRGVDRHPLGESDRLAGPGTPGDERAPLEEESPRPLPRNGDPDPPRAGNIAVSRPPATCQEEFGGTDQVGSVVVAIDAERLSEPGRTG